MMFISALQLLQPKIEQPSFDLIGLDYQKEAAVYATASIIFSTPRMFITRLMLYESTVKLISARTFFSPRIKKYPLCIVRFIVPNGCSESCFRCFITSG